MRNKPDADPVRDAPKGSDQDNVSILWRRAKLIFWIGAAASSAVFVLIWIETVQPLTRIPFYVHLLHPISFGVALFAMRGGKGNLRRVQAVAFWVLLFNLALVILSIEVMYPWQEGFLPVAMVLFVSAAFLPFPRRQLGLAITAVLMTIGSSIIAPMLIPEIAAYWESRGSRGALFERAWRALGVALLGATSVAISRSLYSLQRYRDRAKRLSSYVIQTKLGPADIFISYAREDSNRVRPIALALEDRGWSVWWDRTILPGETWDDLIEEQLETATCVVVVWSDSAVTSEWVRAEASVAADREVLVPVMIDACRLPVRHRQTHAANLAQWYGDPEDEELLNLVTAVERLVGSHQHHAEDSRH